MTIPMALLAVLAVGCSVAGLVAAYREWKDRTRSRIFAEVWERRAFRLQREWRPGIAEERARLAAFNVRPLHDDDRARFRAAWRRASMQLTENPARAVAEADGLIADLAHARGVPAWTMEYDQATPLAWQHPDLEDHYRAARKIAAINGRDAASEAELQEAFGSYKVIADRLLA
jgi:hypothetical protein